MTAVKANKVDVEIPQRKGGACDFFVKIGNLCNPDKMGAMDEDNEEYVDTSHLSKQEGITTDMGAPLLTTSESTGSCTDPEGDLTPATWNDRPEDYSLAELGDELTENDTVAAGDVSSQQMVKKQMRIEDKMLAAIETGWEAFMTFLLGSLILRKLIVPDEF